MQRLIRFSLLLFAIAQGIPTPATAQAQKPLREAEILKELAGGTSNQRLAVLVRESGVDFSLTPESEERLRTLGADDGLIAAIRTAAIPSQNNPSQSVSEEKRTQANQPARAQLSPEAAAKLREGMKRKEEPALQVTWYYPKKTYYVGRGFLRPSLITYLHIGQKKSGYKWLCLWVGVSIPMAGYDELFSVDKVYIVVDGREMTLKVEYSEQNSELENASVGSITGTVSGLGVLKVDIVHDERLEEVARVIAQGQEVYLTLLGSRDRQSFKMSADQIKSFQQVLAFYDSL